MVRSSILLILLALSVSANGQSAQDRVAMAALFSASDRFSIQGRLRVEEGAESFERTLLFRFERGGPNSSLLITVDAPTYLRNLKFLRKDGPRSVQAWVKTGRGLRVLSGDATTEALFGSDFLSSDFSFAGRPWVWSDAKAVPGILGLEAPSLLFPGGKQLLFLREADNLLVGSRDFDSSGVLHRNYEILSWDDRPELPLPLTVRLTDQARGSVSTLRLSNLSEGKNFPAGTFVPGSL